MKRLNALPEKKFLKIFFACFSLSFLIAAFCMPDRSQMLPGLWQIISNPTKGSTNNFSIGGYAATFLNMSLLGFICTGLYCIPGKKSDSAAVLVTILTTGFGAWGIHIVNMWPTMLGVLLHVLLEGFLKKLLPLLQLQLLGLLHLQDLLGVLCIEFS